MKISWGIKIAATYILFVILTLVMVGITMNKDVNLVTDDYYKDELAYQQQINKINRTNQLPEQPAVDYSADTFKITFPSMFLPDQIKGNILFYRPSDHRMDFVKPIYTNSNREVTIAAGNIPRGLWKVKIDWEANGTTYFNESSIMVN